MGQIDAERSDAATLSESARRIRRALKLGTGRSTIASRLSNLVVGASTLLEIAPSRPSRRIDVERFLCRTDGEALAKDWRAVGDDLRSAARRVR